MPSVAELTTAESHRLARDTLAALIRDGRAVLFAGAGFAVPAEFPNWCELLHGLENVCDEFGVGFARDSGLIRTDPLRYADSLKSYINRVNGDIGPYLEHLVRIFRKTPRLTKFHRDVVSLPFRGFITTNFDQTIEAALALQEPGPPEKCVIVPIAPGTLVRDFHQSLAAMNMPRLVAHIHGYYRQPESIVLTAGDYARVYALSDPRGDPPRVIEFLRSVVAAWSLVFVGFSFRDQHFAAFLESASRLWGLWNTDTHIALVETCAETADTDAERATVFHARYGIRTLFYERVGSSHQQLYDIISGIAIALGIESRSAVPDINARMIEGMLG